MQRYRWPAGFFYIVSEQHAMDSTFKFGATTARCSFYEGLAMAELRGVVTAKALDSLRAQMAAWLPRDARVVISCWSAAAFATDFEFIARGFQDDSLSRMLQLPIGNVVNDVQAPLFQRYAHEMIKFGVLRVTFSERAAALAWAARKLAFAERRACVAPRVPMMRLPVMDCAQAGSRRTQ